MRLPTQLSKRKINSHKKDFGHIFILAGSLGFTGAACLTAEASMRSGAGLVTLGIPKSLNCIAAAKLTEVMTKPLKETKEQTLSIKAYPEIVNFLRKIDVLIIGPGLSQNRSTQELVKKLLLSKGNVPIVLDADGINALVAHLDILRTMHNARRTIILTPHPGEFARLLNKPNEYIQENRLKLAKQFAIDYSLTIILKGYKTIVCDARGKYYINTTGNPGMATAGSGDVLSGIIAALLAQKLDPFVASKLATYIHGLSADLAKKEIGEISLVASDIIKFLPNAFKKLYNIPKQKQKQFLHS